MTPRAILGMFPLKFFSEAYVSFTKWTKYMQELRESAVSKIEEVVAKKKKSILGKVFPLPRANFTDSLIPCRVYRCCRNASVNKTRGSTST